MRDGGKTPSPDAKGFDRAALSTRAINAIERVWGPDATRRDLLEPNALERLSHTRGVGRATLAEIERVVASWGLEGAGSRKPVHDDARRKRLRHRGRLYAALRELGALELLRLLVEICAEHLTALRQKVARRPSRRQVAKYERTIANYARWEELFRQWASSLTEGAV